MAQLLELDEGTDDDMPGLVDMDDEGDEGDNRVVCCLEGCHSGGGPQEIIDIELQPKHCITIGTDHQSRGTAHWHGILQHVQKHLNKGGGN